MTYSPKQDEVTLLKGTPKHADNKEPQTKEQGECLAKGTEKAGMPVLWIAKRNKLP